MNVRHTDMQAFSARAWHVGGDRSIPLGPRAVLMGILNMTPDSFSDGGLHNGSIETALSVAEKMVADGATVIDIGGESTRPGAEVVSPVEEQRRVLPVIEALSARNAVLISIDTYRAETAALALRAGAHIVNDVWGGQRDPAILRVAAQAGAGVCLMHNGRDRKTDPDVIADQKLFLDRSLTLAREAGIEDGHLVLDPGFGFAKSVEDNHRLIERFEELHVFGRPLLAGTSRKRFVRAALSRGEAASTDIATVATSVLLRERGAAIFRVHDVASNRDALDVVDAGIAFRGMGS